MAICLLLNFLPSNGSLCHSHPDEQHHLYPSSPIHTEKTAAGKSLFAAKRRSNLIDCRVREAKYTTFFLHNFYIYTLDGPFFSAACDDDIVNHNLVLQDFVELQSAFFLSFSDFQTDRMAIEKKLALSNLPTTMHIIQFFLFSPRQCMQSKYRRTWIVASCILSP